MKTSQTLAFTAAMVITATAAMAQTANTSTSLGMPRGADTIATHANTPIKPAGSGTTPSMGDSNNSANNTLENGVTGTSSLEKLLPAGLHTYTYYPASNVYFLPAKQAYFYAKGGAWYTTATLPADIKLGADIQTVSLRGTM